MPPEGSQLYRVVAPHFVAGVDVSGGTVVTAAPILKQFLRQPLRHLEIYGSVRNWEITPVTHSTTRNHIMIDLETFGHIYNAPIVTIGAVYFDPNTGEIGEKFYEAVDIADAIRFGRTDGETLKWWMKQSDDARKAAVAGAQPLGVVLKKFEEFYKRGNNACPWGNGASFDITIMEHAYLVCLNRKAPWDFWNIRDVRTIVEVAKGICDKPREFGKGTAHNALDDAIHQAGYVSKMWQALRKNAVVASIHEPSDYREPAEDDDDLFGDLTI